MRRPAWPGTSVCVAGIGVSGFAAADALLRLGASVTVLDARAGEPERDRATRLEVLGARVRLGPGAVDALPAGTDLLVISPGWRPDSALPTAAAAAGVPVWGEVELAWRLRDPHRPAPWLAVTGTNGKTTTVRMLAAMLRAAGLRATAAGNVGEAVVEAVLHPDPYDVIAVELSSFQLHWTRTTAFRSAAVLNVAPDHLDWHGSLAAYAADKGRVYQRCEAAGVYNVADPVTERLLRDADVQEGCRAVGFTVGIPAVDMVGVIDDVIVDRAFVTGRAGGAVELGGVDDVRPGGRHNVANALAAAALARSIGVPPVAVRDGLSSFTPDPHRVERVATVRGVLWVDDSKATNPHAAQASLLAHDDVVWIAGGLAKGATFDDLVRAVRDRLRGAVLLGRDRGLVSEALARHAPEVPVVDVAAPETGAMPAVAPTDRALMERALMDRVVAEAARLAGPGATVLLAPACASMDQFASYAARGDAFAEAVRRLARSGR